jgi:hypothetical protein
MSNPYHLIEPGEDAQVLKEFEYIESIAHAVAYQAPARKSGEVFHIKDVDGINRAYSVRKIITDHTGLVGEILIPAKSNSESKIIISWTGTHNMGSLHVDLQRAPGEDSYRKREHQILGQINDAVGIVFEKTKMPVAISVTGHSLGGALAQLTINTCQRAIAENLHDQFLVTNQIVKAIQIKKIKSDFKKQIDAHADFPVNQNEIPHELRNNLTHVSQLTIGTWNSAGILKAVERNSNVLAQLLESVGVHQVARFGMVKGDGVQMSGEGSIFSKAPASDVKILKVKIHESGLKETLVKVALLGLAAMGIVSVGFSHWRSDDALNKCEKPKKKAATDEAVSGTGFCVAAIVGLIGVQMISQIRKHTATHFQGEMTSPINYKIYHNNSQVEQQKLKQKLQDKSILLQTMPAQYGLYCLRHLGAATSIVSNKASQLLSSSKTSSQTIVM